MAQILVVDDHPDAAASLAELMACHGHDARPVSSGPAALAALAAFAPDACLVDLRMPGMDGYELAARLRAALGREVLLVAVTGETYAAADPRAWAFDRVVVKPPSPDDLLGALADIGPG